MLIWTNSAKQGDAPSRHHPAFDIEKSLLHPQPLPLQPPVDELAEERIQDGGQRDEHQHTHDAHQAPADADRRQHPDGRQAYGGAYYMGVDQVPLHLLQDQEQHHEHQRLHGRDHQQHERAHDAPDERAHDGDQRRHRDEAPHQQGVGHPQEGHGQKEHGPQYHCLYALTGDKAGKHLVAEGADPHGLLRPPLRQERVERLAALKSQLLLLQQYINGKDKCYRWRK